MRNKAIVNPANGAKIREFNYIFQVQDIKTGELTTVSYILVTDQKIPPVIWNSRGDGSWNARPEFAEEFIKNGEQWYDFTVFGGDLNNVKKIAQPSGDGPEGYKLHTDYRLDVNLNPGKFYDVQGKTHPFEYQVQRWSDLKGIWVCVNHGTADDFDTAVQMGKTAFEALKI